MKENKTAFLTFRLPESVNTALRQIAKRESRSAGGQALYYIMQGIKHEQQQLDGQDKPDAK